jgi:hypothetical protein
LGKGGYEDVCDISRLAKDKDILLLASRVKKIKD